MKLELELPDGVVEAIARRAAELVLERIEIPAPAAGSPWLTTGQAAEYLSCAEQRIYDLRTSGRLTRFKEGGRVMIARSELDLLVREERVLSPAERARIVA